MCKWIKTTLKKSIRTSVIFACMLNAYAFAWLEMKMVKKRWFKRRIYLFNSALYVYHGLKPWKINNSSSKNVILCFAFWRETAINRVMCFFFGYFRFCVSTAHLQFLSFSLTQSSTELFVFDRLFISFSYWMTCALKHAYILPSRQTLPRKSAERKKLLHLPINIWQMNCQY